MPTRKVVLEVFGLMDHDKNEVDQFTSTQFIKLQRFNYPYNCLTLDIPRDYRIDNQITFSFTKSESSVEIFLEDRLSSLSRDNPYSRDSYRGPRFALPNLTDSQYAKYSVDFEQKVFVPEDASIGCKNYPWGPHHSYNDCDEAYMENFINENYPPGFRPFFMSKDETQATSTPVFLNDTEYQYFNGYTRNDCPLPCTRTSISAASMIDSISYSNLSYIDLILPQTILVTTTFYPKFSLSELLASLGGSMGLWLGLGVLQLVQTMAGVVPAVENIQNRGLPAQNDLVEEGTVIQELCCIINLFQV